MSRSPTIGIDLGTNFSCVAVWQHRRIEIIPNDNGSRTTPSIVFFKTIQRYEDLKYRTEIEHVVGEAAISPTEFNPHNGIICSKRSLGQTFNAEYIQNNQNKLVINKLNGKPNYLINFENDGHINIYPEQILAMILIKMINTAENYLQCKIKEAVITVPSFFTDAQRKATLNAASIAGLSVKRLINDTTAVAIAYGFDKKLKYKRNVLVFDLGAGSFSVSIIIVDNENIEVKATNGNTHLGGEDFDNEMVEYFIDEIKDKHDDVNFNARLLCKLKNACEKAKRILSSSSTANIELSPLTNEIDFNATISRSKFEELNNHLFHKTIEIVNKLFKNCQMEKSAINEILLIGGSSRIPKIQKLLKKMFVNVPFNKTMNADESAAYGAAVLAAKLDEKTNLNVKDVTPYTLRVCNRPGNDYIIVKRNKEIPFLDSYNSIHTSHTFEVTEGELLYKNDNIQLGTFDLNITKKTIFSFNINLNGILEIIKYSDDDKRLSNTEIISAREDLDEIHLREMWSFINELIMTESERREAATAKNNLEDYCRNIKSNCNTDISDIELVNLCDEIIEHLNVIPLGTASYYNNEMELLKTKQSTSEPIPSTSDADKYKFLHFDDAIEASEFDSKLNSKKELQNNDCNYYDQLDNKIIEKTTENKNSKKLLGSIPKNNNYDDNSYLNPGCKNIAEKHNETAYDFHKRDNSSELDQTTSSHTEEKSNDNNQYFSKEIDKNRRVGRRTNKIVLGKATSSNRPDSGYSNKKYSNVKTSTATEFGCKTSAKEKSCKLEDGTSNLIKDGADTTFENKSSETKKNKNSNFVQQIRNIFQ